jgi:hypothetical protein
MKEKEMRPPIAVFYPYRGMTDGKWQLLRLSVALCYVYSFLHACLNHQHAPLHSVMPFNTMNMRKLTSDK